MSGPVKVEPFLESPAFGRALDSAPRPVFATFSDGRTGRFASESDAEFWAEFTGRTVVTNRP